METITRKTPVCDITGKEIRIGCRIVYPIRVGNNPILRVMDVTEIVYWKKSIMIRGTIGHNGKIIPRWTKNSNQCAVVSKESSFSI